LDRHLTSDQIEELLRLDRGDEENSANDQIDERARIHLKHCSLCQTRVRAEGKAMERLAQLKPGAIEARSPECPSDSAWLELAAGISSTPESLLSHAVQCDHCGPLLNEAIADLTGECTFPEEARIAGLDSATPKWQSDVAGRLCGSEPASLAGARLVSAAPHPRPRRLEFWPLYAFAAMVLLTLSVWTVIHPFRTPSPQVLLADAYFEHRTLELRIPEAKQALIRLQRGGGFSNLDKPNSLLRAESIIAEHLRKKPNDVDFLDAKARADLIDGNFESAIKSVQRAMESQPLSPILMTDLATAYFARAEATGQAIDYGRAIDNLSKVLSKSPDDSLALFNRAITEERMFLLDDAVADWEHFLKVESDPAWRNEGQQRLDNLRHKIEERKHATVLPLHDPSTATAALHLRATWSPTLDEDYLHVATTEWLPAMRPVGAAENSVERTALKALSEELHQQHRDDWLGDLTNGAPSPAWAEGSQELAAAFRANAVGNIGGIVSHAARSMRLFQLARNQAGEAGARLEYASGLNRAERGHDCMSAANGAIEQTRNRRYPWIEINALYELSTCDFLNGNPVAAIASAHRAEALAKSAQYPALALDGAYYLDGVTASWVAPPGSWDQIRAGLGTFWTVPYPASSGANFYLDLGFAAETEGMWQTAEMAGRETILMHSQEEDRNYQAAAHHWLAQIAEAAGDASLADAEYQSAATVLKSSAVDTRSATDTLEIERAALEVRQGKFAMASARLDAIQPSLGVFSKQYATILYLETSGEIHLHSGQSRLAQSELEKATWLIESNQASLNSDTALFAWQRNTSQAYKSIVELYSRKYHDPARSFALLEWSRAAPLRAVQANRAPFDTPANFEKLAASVYLPEQLRLKPGTALITWMPLQTGLTIWLVDANGIHTAWVDVSQERLEGAVETFARLCADPLSDMTLVDRGSRQLYDWLIKPVSPMLRGSTTLVIEPDDSFNSIPFQALTSPTGEYLTDRFLIIESPGYGYSKLLRSDRDVSPNSIILAVGNPLLNSPEGVHLRALPDADAEAHYVSMMFAHPHLLTARQATITNVLHWLPQAEVFHFAGHSLSQGSEPGLLLTSTGTDKTVLLGRSQLRPRCMEKLKLAILSACDTGVSNGGLGDPGSLVRLFLQAGVPQVIASKWSVDSSTTSELMDNLYARLLAGDSVNRALANAERSMRSNTATSHPYYWAAFSEFGGA
jgi:CHAT domain-containing protein